METTTRLAAEQKQGSPAQTLCYYLGTFEQRALWTPVRAPLCKFTTPQRSQIPALTGVQFNHKNKVWPWEYSVGSQSNVVAGMLPRMSKYFRSGRKRTPQSLEAHKITRSQTQMQKYDLSVASAKHFGISSGKHIFNLQLWSTLRGIKQLKDWKLKFVCKLCVVVSWECWVLCWTPSRDEKRSLNWEKGVEKCTRR